MAAKVRETGPQTGDKEFAQALSYITGVTGIYAVVLDENGILQHQPEVVKCLCDACGDIDGARCKKIRHRLYMQSLGGATPTVGRCPCSNTNAVALPVIIEGARISTWVLCQFVYSDGPPGSLPPAIDDTTLPHMDRNGLQFLQLLITALCKPILQLQQTNQELFKRNLAVSSLAYTDPLLGVPNGNQLQQDLDAETKGSLLLLEVRGLQKMNETYGRAAVDELLRALRDRLFALAIPNSRVYRLAAARLGVWAQCQPGDLVPHARELLAYCDAPLRLQGSEAASCMPFEAAVGILPLDQLPAHDLDSVRSAVAYVLHQGAATGQVAMLDGQQHHGYTRRRQLEKELPAAVNAGMRGFSVAYQPFYDPVGGLWKGVEALCRWESERFGAVPPTEFINIAEANGLINEIGFWVLDTAIGQVTRLGLTGAEQFVLGVNLSPLQLAHPGLADRVLEIVRRHGYPPAKLCLEITESAAMDFTACQLDMLQALRSHGIFLALDNFGISYASLRSLYKLPVRVIKTDRSLVQGLAGNPFLQRLFYVMGELAHISNMLIVAVGVEEQAQADTLLMEGADYFQGHLYCKPLGVQGLKEMKNRFYSSAIAAHTPGYTQAGIAAGANPREGYTLPPALYSILNRCMHILFTHPQVDEAIRQVLEIVGGALKVSRAYVCLRGEGGRYDLTHLWCAPGVTGFGSAAPGGQPQGPAHTGRQRLAPGEMFVTADTSTLPREMRTQMEAHGVKAFAEFPLLLDNSLVGTVSFNDCSRVRYWAREDLRMLRLLANMLAGALGKSDLLRRIARQKEELQQILDKIDALVYVAVPETGELLFANHLTRNTFKLNDLREVKCWRALQGQSGPCSFCPVQRLRQSPREIQHYELYNELLGNFLQIGASTINWQSNQNAVLFSAFDINELINRQHWLEKTATVDVLTGVCNRASFLAAADPLLKKAAAERKNCTLAFLDVDGLKRENDLRGHKAGDELLCTIVSCVQRKTRDTDLVGRYGGDEFLVLFYGCDEANAEKSLEGMLAELALLSDHETGRHFSFSYGLACTGAIPYHTGGNYLEELIAIADKRMLAYKRTRRQGGRDSGQNG